MIGAFERPQQREVPAHHQPQPKLIDTLLATIFRSVLLFVFGMAYGMIVTHLHDEQGLAPVKVEGIRRDTWRYLLFWGVAGVALGRLLPWVDVLWEEALAAGQEGGSGESSGETLKTNGSADNKSERLRASSGTSLTTGVAHADCFCYRTWHLCTPQPNESFANFHIAETAMDIDAPGVSHTRACQSGPLVSNRPLQARLSPLGCHWHIWHFRSPWDKS